MTSARLRSSTNNDRPRVVLVIWSTSTGGSEKQACLLAQYLQQHSIADATVCALFKGDGTVVDAFKDAGFRWVYVDLPAGNGIGKNWVSQFSAYRKALRGAKPDAIIAYTALPNILSAVIWRFTSARALIWNQRDANGIGISKHFLASLLCRFPSFFVSNSEAGKEFLIRRLHVRAGRIAVILNGVESGRKTGNGEWRGRNGISPDACAVAMIANLTENKDHATLLRAWRILTRQAGNGRIQLILVGRKETTHTQLVSLAQSLEIADSVKFAGPVENVQEVLRAIDLCVHCSNSEGSSNAVIEAMLAGLPVVGTDVPGMREVVGEKNYRYLSRPGDPGDLAEKIQMFVQNKHERQRVGALNKSAAAQKYSYEIMGKSYAELLGRLLKARHARAIP